MDTAASTAAQWSGSWSTYDKSNLWTLCQADNNSKRDLTVVEWHEALARRKRPASPSLVITGDYSIGGKRR